LERAGQKRICGWHSLSWGGAVAAYGVQRVAVPLAGMAGALVGSVAGDSKRWRAPAAEAWDGQTVGERERYLGHRYQR
jgi:hypothetical protein